MYKKYPGFHFVFLIIFIVQLMSNSDTLTDIFLFKGVHYISKPLITITLLIWLLSQTGFKGRYSKSIAIGLLFGLFGDILLMLTNRYPGLFLAGLGSFLIGHLFYIRAFYIDYSFNKTVHPEHRKNAIIAYSFFIVIFMGLVVPSLEYKMIAPILLYGVTIALMGVLAVCRFGRVNATSYKMVFLGSILFVISDAVLGYNKFVTSVPLASYIIMSTYMVAQYLITAGNIERKIKRKVEDI